MKRMIKTYMRKLAGVLPLALVFCLCACSKGEEVSPVVDDGAPVELSLRITAEAGDASEPAFGEDSGEQHEYIHSLCVFIADASGKIEKKIQPDFAGDIYAAEGNLVEYVSEPFQLASGDKNIYAFANWETLDDEVVNAVIAKTEGEVLTDADLNAITVDNPVAKLDFKNDKFIPMSVKETAAVDKSTRSLSVGLYRLIGKVRLNVSKSEGDNEAIKVREVVISGFADKVALMPGATAEGVAFDRSYPLSLNKDLLPAAPVQDWFYVNETWGKSPFGVVMTTEQFGGEMLYSGVTQRKEIERNYVYPLTLTIADYYLDWTITSTVAPIGVYPIEVQATLDGKYHVAIAEGAQFNFQVNGIRKGNQMGESFPATFSWEVSDNPNGTVVKNEGGLLDAYLSAGAPVGGALEFLKLHASWTTAGGQAMSRTYPVVIDVIDITDVVFKSGRRNFCIPAKNGVYECVNMYLSNGNE